MTERFADLTDAGRTLGRDLAPRFGAIAGLVVLGVEPHGLVVALAAAAEMGTRALGIASEPGAEDAPSVAGHVVVLVDDGVVGGTTARRLGGQLRALGPKRLVLAVPVCPREPYAELARVFDEVIALQRPFMMRSLAWHYDDFPKVPDPQVP